MRNIKDITKRMSAYGILIALAMVLGYFERFIPFAGAIPGVKPGFANIAVLIALYSLGDRAGAEIAVLRALLTGLVFTGVTALFYSATGAAVSVLVMIPLKRTGRFGVAGVSVGGAAAHILAQVAVSRLLLGSWAAAIYMPALLFAACVTGVFNGVVSGAVMERLKLLR